MATFSSVTRQHVLAALAEYDDRGGDGLRELYGLAETPGYTLAHEGRGYDATVVLGVAHRHATGRLAPSDEIANDLAAAVAILRKRGFEVTEPPSARAVRQPAARAPRATRAAATKAPARATLSTSTRAAAAREERLAICPTCSMALPGTGVCDTCS